MFTPRKYPRFPISGSAIVRTFSNNVKFPGTIEMFSKGGIGISTDVFIKKGTSINLEIKIQTGTHHSKCQMSGIVKTFTEWGEKSLLGIQFDREISQKNQPQIFEFLGRLERELITDYGAPS